MNRSTLRLYPDILTVEDVQKILRIRSRVSVYKLIKGGKLTAKKVAGKYLIPKSGLIMFFESVKTDGDVCYNAPDSADELHSN